jgi:hypothetical protein
VFQRIRRLARQSSVPKILRKHFRPYRPGTLVITCRTFPQSSRVDLQLALDEFFARKDGIRHLGLDLRAEGIGIAELLDASAEHRLQRLISGQRLDIAPLQYDDVDVGEAVPARCLRRALWLSTAEGTPFAVLIRSTGLAWHLEIAVPGGEAGLKFSEQFFDILEKEINKGRAYRGKVISLEGVSDHGGGRICVVKVHLLRQVRREEVILPERTIALLERNLAGFIGVRDGIRKLGLSVKKGLLFYGPPGTGKTHTLHYLAGALPGHTTLVITADQVVLLEHYFKLARFLQPSIIVVEDVDLIARERTQLRGSGQEMLLNKYAARERADRDGNLILLGLRH